MPQIVKIVEYEVTGEIITFHHSMWGWKDWGTNYWLSSLGMFPYFSNITIKKKDRILKQLFPYPFLI